MTSDAPEMRRVLPHDLAAEEAVIGAILFAGHSMHQVADLLSSGDFYHPVLQSIYEAMVALDQAAQPIDAITVADSMRKQGTIGKLRAYDGEAYLVELSTKIATIENIAFHARLVREKAVARRLIEAGSQIVTWGYAEHLQVDRYLDEAQQAVFGVAMQSTVTQGSYEYTKALLKGAITRLERRYQRKEAITGVPTGYSKFDEMTAGLQPGDLVIIAARPSMGKTAFVMNIVANAAIEHREPTLVFSLEMSKASLLDRLLCADARVDSQRLRSGFLETSDWIHITKAAQRLSEASIAIEDTGAPTVLDLRAKARRWRADPKAFPPGGNRTGLLVVDYLQLIQGRAGKEVSREQVISEVSRGLKALAKELEMPVVALSQLNRSVESRADKRPMMSDLRESGALEQDADLICFIYRDEVYDEDSADKGIAEIIIEKQRNGPTGTVRLAFLKQYTRFENLAEDRHAR